MKTTDLSARYSEAGMWSGSITWCALIIIGLVICEFTTQPILGVIVVCSKFGWNDFLLAYLVKRVDASRGRARAVPWFCLAFGLLKVVNASVFLAMGLTFMLGAPFGPAGFQAILLRWISAWAVAGIGYLLITTVILGGAYYARQSQIKVWLTSPIPLWHPRPKDQRGQPRLENLVDLVLLAALLPAYLAFFSLLPLFGEVIEPQPRGSIVLVIVCLVAVWSTLLGFLLWKIFLALKKRFAAASPFECWDGDALGKAMIAKISSARRVRLLLHLYQSGAIPVP